MLHVYCDATARYIAMSLLLHQPSTSAPLHEVVWLTFSMEDGIIGERSEPSH